MILEQSDSPGKLQLEMVQAFLLPHTEFRLRIRREFHKNLRKMEVR